ncbi:MAG: hypothetical protein ACOX37_06025 [Bacillota bacterium]
MAREESRGALYRRDFPKTDNVNWLKNITVQKDGDKTRLTITDVDLKHFQAGTSNQRLRFKGVIIHGSKNRQHQSQAL